MVALQKGITPYVQTIAFFHANLLRRYLSEMKNESGEADVVAAELAASRDVPQSWYTFAHLCQDAGWDLTKTEIQTQGFEVDIQETEQRSRSMRS